MIELLSQEQFYVLKTKNKWEISVSKNIDFLKWELILKINKLDDYEKFYKDVNDFTIENFGNEISSEFMEVQKKEWVTKFYTFLRNDAPKYWKISPQTRSTAHVFRHAPIIKNQKGEWVQPFINTETPNVFLPFENDANNSTEYNFINKEYLEEEMARKFFNELEIQQPNEYDYIRNIVLKKYDNELNETIEIDNDVLAFDFYSLLSYYKKIIDTNEEDEFIELLRDNLLLVGTDNILHKPKELYVKSDILSKYLSVDALYFDALFYKHALKEFKEQFVNEFIIKLGVKTEPIISSHHIYYDWLPQHFKKILNSFSYYWFEYVDDYKCHSFTDAYNKKRITKEISIYLWNEFLPNNKNTFTAKISTREYRKRYSDYKKVDSTFFYELKTFEWIYNKNGNAKKVSDIFVEDLADEYNIYNGLVELLGIEKHTQDLQEKYGVTKDEQETFEIGNKFKALIGKYLSIEEAFNLLEEKKEKNKRERQEQEFEVIQQITQVQLAEELEKTEPQDINEKLQKKWEEKKNRPVNKPHSSIHQSEELVFDSNSQGIQSLGNNLPFFIEPSTITEEGAENVIDTAKAEQKLKSKDTTAQEQAEIAKEQVDILELLNETPCYTFKWFKVLMELMHAGKQEFTQRTTQIDFSRYEMICSDKILHLTEPTRPVPSWICDAEKISIVAVLTGTTTVKLDGLIIKTSDNSVDVSIELNNKIFNDLKQAKKIRVSAVDNTNIIDSLETRFLQLDKEDDFDMNENLPQNISFIYGPPGTGKTTELVRQVSELLTNEPNAKILVLTPTNKAADVVAIKMANNDVCYDGLARYGATESLYLIEDIGCVTNRDTTDLKGWHNIVVATAARYAYDFIQPDDTAICDYPWDYIFIDEASMIDILTITYILYKGANSKRIIISGDPKQIQPVAQNDMPAINIYNMVGLQGFADALFKYTRYPVQGLMTQHRSISIIGQAVSNFAYDGLVDSDVNRAPMKPLKLDGIDIKNVNFIGFDVIELDDIRGLNSIANSAFNLYSVIFTYNMIEYTIKQIEKNHSNKEYSIGVVCAYKAQSDAIKNMLENRPLNTDFCSVSCGTVHSFQGDECDIMFIVLNPPAICTKGTHVNNENIINVAMSRARDYLFFILPSGHQKGFDMKNRIGAVVPYTDRTIYNSHDIEAVMFNGNNNFIYENTHVTCHMPINVYCDESAIYEIRMSDDALDIKINL
ncbi:MAG: AAA family ATPase [Paludibacteraceae bacterium]|nr:AAA family ATPase [Paludibacteraceae bacterium]